MPALHYETNVIAREPCGQAHQLNHDGKARRRVIGIDLGAETIKLVECHAANGYLQCVREQLIEHGKNPGQRLIEALRHWGWERIEAARATGRLSRLLTLNRVPVKQARIRAFRFLFGDTPATIVSIGSRGFSVLELRANGVEVFRENSRCSQGTGNFLRQLVERFGLDLAEASELCAEVEDPAPLSGRCPVILKTDMTHLANKGENRARILAGLFDAVCENVMSLIKPGVSPPTVYLIGGVSQARRVQLTLKRLLAEAGMTLVILPNEQALFFDALGAAVLAAEFGGEPPALDSLVAPRTDTEFMHVPPLRDSLNHVKRLPAPPKQLLDSNPLRLVLGFDIGSTGSKLVVLDADSKQPVWESYRPTAGDPVGAAQALLQKFVGECTLSPNNPCAHESSMREYAAARTPATTHQRPMHRIVGFGVTGSGREIVGSLLITCYGKDAVFILNEIVAHAEGALYYDPRVDTIFEIGGQDAKYIRLANGRVIDCAMNEACSAGTGSFIEEQGKRFAGVLHPAELSQLALQACRGVSLGQHCSVFMAEVIDQAVAAGVPQEEIIAGLFDSVVQNYLHRVKGQRQVGRVIFCQGMPFSSDALAAAVARQTGSEVIVPPSPGTVGALGIALIALRELEWTRHGGFDPHLFLRTRVEHKESFVCKSNAGCGGAGNKCKIECIHTELAGQRQRFIWGGSCQLYDRGTHKKKLPARAPDPFREREELVAKLLAQLDSKRSRTGQRRSIAISDEFALKSLFPFFATFFTELGFELVVPERGDQATLKRGIQQANVPYCAPMQLFHGLTASMAETSADFIFLPMIRATPRTANEPTATICPIAQANPDILRWDLKSKLGARVVSPVIDIGPGNLDSPEFIRACQNIAFELGAPLRACRAAFAAAKSAQLEFDRACIELGMRALEFCAKHGILPVVVLGRPYTIYNHVLNSNVPALLREQGAIPIPVDCYPVQPDAPVFGDIYWGYSQRILRAAHQIRRTQGVYSIFCSNYSCGPDSFTLHFYNYIMEGKPFAVIETDGHSGDAGTKTRIEAFLYCAQQDMHSNTLANRPNDLRCVSVGEFRLSHARREQRFLVPMLGPGSDVVTACLSGLGYQAETLPMPDTECLRIGRRYTSGKECVPMCMTLGTLLRRLDSERSARSQFVLVMPRANGPCRFGVYNVLNRITLERLGLNERVAIWSPRDSGYFDDTPPGFAMLVFAGFMAADLLHAALLDTRPCEARPGAADLIYRKYITQLLELCKRAAKNDLSGAAVLHETVTGDIFGIPALLEQAAREFAAIKTEKPRPTVLIVGEIYVRLVPFANDFIIEKLEARGCKTRLAPGTEWLEYVDYLNRRRGHQRLPTRVSSFIQRLIRARTYRIMARALGWPPHAPISESIRAAEPYLRQALHGEAILTLGTALHSWHAGSIDAAVSVGPLECMPNKIAEAQFFHITEQEGLPNLTISLVGDPMDIEVLENFVFEVKSRFQR
ncbi:MAG: acyl-CoA dehydratase activase-related protein, partial [Verrucomicrobiae bacterium]|nr:acyl-CoA dehydratase activase-related protein [Verrucomicrobiae bacterium]